MYHISMSKSSFLLFQTAPFIFCCYFCIINKTEFQSKLLSNAVGGLMFSSTNPLDLHTKILSLLIGVVKDLKSSLNTKLFCDPSSPKYL